MRVDQDPSAEEQRPVKQSFCRSLRRDTHWKCLILTLLITGCLAAISWCRLTVVARVVSTMPSYVAQYDPAATTSRTSPCEDGYVYIPVAFVVMLYLVYLVECWHCHTRLELQCKVDVNTVYERIHSMRESIPIVWWKAVCYHYVRRTRQVTRYRNGDAFTTTQVYYERVNSHTASSCFNFTACGIKDISKKLLNLEQYPATKIKFTKGFSFSVYDAEQEFEEQRAHFFHTHERMDDYMETREGLDLMNVNFKEYMICFADPDNLPWYISQVVFWLCSLLLMSWPLRVIIEYKTAYVHYHVNKLFGTNYLDPAQAEARIPRVNTMESSEIELSIRNNYSMVPSYSEALLMDCADTTHPQSQQGYGAVTTPGGSIPLVHIGNSICIAPAMNSSYLPTPLPNGTYTPMTCATNGHLSGTTYHNVQANGYIPLGGGPLVSRHSMNFSSSDTIGGVQRRRRKRRRKRRRQSYTDAIQAPSDSDGTHHQHRLSGRSQASTSTPDSPSGEDNLTMPSRDSSFGTIDSGGVDNSSNGNEVASNEDSSTRSSRGAENILVSVNDAPKQRQQQEQQEQGGTENEGYTAETTKSPAAKREAPPAYELALAMTRAGMSTTIQTAIPGRTAREHAKLPFPIREVRAERPTSLPSTMSRVPAYQQDTAPVIQDRPEPPIRLMETSL